MRTKNDLTVKEFFNKEDEIYNWLKENVNKVVKPAKFRDNNWPKIQKEIEEDLGQVHPLYGKCCHVAHFILFLLGGKANNHQLKISKPKKFYKEYKTTHWWLEVDRDGIVAIADLTKSQFNMFDVDIEEFYSDKVNQDIGFPFFVVGKPKRWEHYEENVPSRDVLELGRRYRKEFGSAGGLDFWIDEFDRLQAREQNELDKIEIDMRKERRAIINKIKLRKKYSSDVGIPKLKEQLDKQNQFKKEHNERRRKESQERKNSYSRRYQ